MDRTIIVDDQNALVSTDRLTFRLMDSERILHHQNGFFVITHGRRALRVEVV
jgi:hypothetical protein